MTTEADTTELVQLQILVTESDWITLFDQVEIWRSRDELLGYLAPRPHPQAGRR